MTAKIWRNQYMLMQGGGRMGMVSKEDVRFKKRRQMIKRSSELLVGFGRVLPDTRKVGRADVSGHSSYSL
ncbi:MAG: hypothetical protein ACRES0_24460, partial [Pseudomonas sp.]